MLILLLVHLVVVHYFFVCLFVFFFKFTDPIWLQFNWSITTVQLEISVVKFRCPGAFFQLLRMRNTYFATMLQLDSPAWVYMYSSYLIITNIVRKILHGPTCKNIIWPHGIRKIWGLAEQKTHPPPYQTVPPYLIKFTFKLCWLDYMSEYWPKM